MARIFKFIVAVIKVVLFLTTCASSLNQKHYCHFSTVFVLNVSNLFLT